jgi:hypothetical protein
MALAHFQRTFTDASGNVKPGLSVTVRRESDNGLAALFSDAGSVTPKSNPFSTDASGYGSFYVVGGRYRIQATDIDWRNEDIFYVDQAITDHSALADPHSQYADQATTYTETEVDSLLDDKAAIAGQTFTGDIAAPKITASTGILFGTDTAAANTLDDYEEGTWTPVMTGVTLTTAFGSYVKIGNLVTAHFRISSDSLTSSAAASISGLPFTRDFSQENRGAGFINFSQSTTPASLLFAASSSAVNFRESSGGAILSITQVSGNLYWMTLVYQAA